VGVGATEAALLGADERELTVGADVRVVAAGVQAIGGKAAQSRGRTGILVRCFRDGGRTDVGGAGLGVEEDLAVDDAVEHLKLLTVATDELDGGALPQ